MEADGRADLPICLQASDEAPGNPSKTIEDSVVPAGGKGVRHANFVNNPAEFDCGRNAPEASRAAQQGRV